MRYHGQQLRALAAMLIIITALLKSLTDCISSFFHEIVISLKIPFKGGVIKAHLPVFTY